MQQIWLARFRFLARGGASVFGVLSAGRFGLAALVCVLTIVMHDRPVRAEQPSPPLTLQGSIILEDVAGRIDHMAVDLGRKRLIVAALGNNTVEVIDITAGRVVHRISGLRSPQGVAYIKATDTIAVANAGDGSVRFYRADDFTDLGRVELGDDADNIRVLYDTSNIVVGYGNGALAIIDSVQRAKLGDIKLPAHPEGFQIAPKTHLAFVNLPDARQVARVELDAGRVTPLWQPPALRANFPMALDEASASIAVVFRRPAAFVLLDAKSGAAKAQLETCGDADDVFIDAKRNRAYISCGDGVVDVIEQSGGTYRSLARIKTESGARTSLFVPQLDRLFVAARAGLLGHRASILVFRPEP